MRAVDIQATRGGDTRSKNGIAHPFFPRGQIRFELRQRKNPSAFQANTFAWFSTQSKLRHPGSFCNFML
jgi:hypothetical protein